MAATSAKGSINLIFGMIISTVISSVGVILLARLLTPSEYGLVAIAWIAPNLIALFREWGLNSAATKYIAQYSEEKEYHSLRRVALSSFIFISTIGLILSISTFLLSDIIASDILSRPEVANLIRISALSVLAGGFIVISQAVLIGLEKMGFNSILMIVRSILVAFLSVFLVIMGQGALGAIMGTTIGLFITGILGIVLSRKAIESNSLARKPTVSPRIGVTTVKLLKYGLPVSIASISLGMMSQFLLLYAALRVTDVTVGNYQVALNVIILITFISSPINTVLMPAFSRISHENNKLAIPAVFRFSVKISALVIVPCAMIMIALSEPAVVTLFGGNYPDAPFFLGLLATNYLFVIMGSHGITNLLQGQAKTGVYLKLTMMTVLLGIPLGIVLIFIYGVAGLIVASILANVPYLIGGLRFIKVRYLAVIDWESSVKIMISSIVAALCAYSVIVIHMMPEWMELIIGTALFLIVYVLVISFIRTIRDDEIAILNDSLKESGPIYRLFRPILALMERASERQKTLDHR